ncbi:hypothetical protein [Nocardiopsis coralliicola]
MVIAGAVVALLAVSTVATQGIRSISEARHSPEAPVQELIAAWEAGDYGAVVLLLGEDAEPRPSISGEDLESGYAPPADLRITGWEQPNAGGSSLDADEADTVLVEVEYTVEGEEYTVQLATEREPTGVVRPWRLHENAADALLGRVRLAPEDDCEVSVAAAPPQDFGPFSMPRLREPMALLPGVYRVSARHAEPLFVDDPQVSEAAVTTDHTAQDPLELAPEPDYEILPEVAEKTGEQIDAHIDDCAAMEEGSRPGCPFSVHPNSETYREVESITWELVEQPEFTLERASEQAMHGSPISVHGTEPGLAEATVTFADEARGPRVQTEEVEFDIGGHVRSEEGEIVWDWRL